MIAEQIQQSIRDIRCISINILVSTLKLVQGS
jgi:hypothetical protein